MAKPERVISIVEYLATHQGLRAITEISNSLRLSKSTVHRILSSLVDFEWVVQDQSTRRYRLGGRFLEIGLSSLSYLDLSNVSLPYLHKLRDTTNETSMLALRVGLERVFIAQVPSTLEVRMMVELGKRNPLWCGAQGKAILAYMEESEVEAVMNELIKSGTRVLASGTIIDIDGLSKELAEIRRQGFAVSFAERVPGAAAVAAPIFERDRRVVGAIAIGGPLQRFSPDIVNRFGRLVSQAATEISLEFGHSPEQQSKEKNDRVPL